MTFVELHGLEGYPNFEPNSYHDTHLITTYHNQLRMSMR